MAKRPTGNGIFKDLSLRFSSGGYREKSFEFSVRQVLKEKGYVGGQLPARRPGLAFEQIVGCPRLPNKFETSC
jgi:hypothetical protein